MATLVAEVVGRVVLDRPRVVWLVEVRGAGVDRLRGCDVTEVNRVKGIFSLD